MTVGLGRRARSIEEFGINMGALAQLPAENYRPLEPQPTDVFITCWGKSGTTMMQQMFHQLRMIAATGAGDMDFDDISRMTPWGDTAALANLDMNEAQRASPRGFKSHREYERLPTGCRYVITLRDPHETFASMHRFFDGWVIERGSVAKEDFMPFWMSGGPGGCDYYTHLLSWWARRDEGDTLLTTYRWAVKNRAAMIGKLARLCGIEPTDELVAKVGELTSREFMYAHKDKFDDAMMQRAFEEKLGFPPDSEATKVHAEGSDPKSVPPAIAEQIDAMWAERVTPVTGLANFAELAAELEA